MHDYATKEKQVKNQRGAIIVEATLALPFFMFAIFTLLTITQIAYTQARVNVALDSATKQLAEYMHVYYATGAAGVAEQSGGKSSQIANEVADVLQKLGDNLGSVNSEMGQFVTDAGNAIQGDSIYLMLKNLFGTTVAKQMLLNNLKDSPGDTGEAFMKRNRIQSLNLDGSRFLEGDKNIFMRVNYDIQVVKLLRLDYSFHLSHCAYAQAWGG